MNTEIASTLRVEGLGPGVCEKVHSHKFITIEIGMMG